MSYCRWSSDDFQCDVYVYEGVDDVFHIHVAGNRRVYKEPLPPAVPLDRDNLAAYMERHKKVMEMVGGAELTPIGLPHDGDSFYEPDAQACADRLKELRALGYKIPQYAIDTLEQEGANNVSS